MQVIIPMSGMGTRFLEAGYDKPKPLIEVDGKPIIDHVVNLFGSDDEFLFICNEKHIDEFQIDEYVKSLVAKAKVFVVPSHAPKGPIYDIILASGLIDDDKPTLVNYCDFNQYWDYQDFKVFVAERELDGAVICYKGFHPHLLGDDFYAGCRTDEDLNLLEIKEKHSFTPNKMDTFQSSGTYYFGSGRILKKYGMRIMDEGISVNGEFYASLPYSLMIEDGLKNAVYPVEYFCQWGTPRDLKEYQYWSEIFKKHQYAG
ncbi:NTP transferase domain-containing protein [Candidatus Gracilibacteria bacterium]|nr:NTP transferase domain-containing protein [Candidatus Gracilibacteria bacterium]